MSQSPARGEQFQYEGSYADAARQLNRLVRAGRSYSGHERNCCFLNVRGERFANASLVSGFDFAEDGRAVAVCDWDGDGAQDLWVANRTAPQVRLMRNTLGVSRRSVAFELRGTKSNRDAVGARVRLRLASPDESLVLQRTVRAGEGFLACHSKHVHFGLGEATRIESLQVRWPNGETEAFGAIDDAAGRYQLVEGSGRAAPVGPTTVAKLASTPTPDVELPAQTFAAWNLLTEPTPTPPLICQRMDGGEWDVTAPAGKPLLVNLWATWCQPCLVELAEWSRRAEDFTSRDVGVLAVCVDSVSDQPAPEADPRALLERLGFPFTAGLATPELLDGLQHLHNVVYDHHRPLPVPTSILLDGQGRLRAVYKGPVSVDRVLADVELLNSEDLIDAALPFPGRWLGTPPGAANLSLLVKELWNDGYEAEALTLADRLDDDRFRPRQIAARLFLAEALARRDPSAAASQAAAVLRLDPGNAAAHERMALLLARSGKVQQAASSFEQAIRCSEPPQARTHFNYGLLLRQTRSLDKAAEQFEIAARLDPDLAPAHEQLGLIRAAQQDFARAATHFQAAAALDPAERRLQVNLAMAWDRLGRDAEAWQVLQGLVHERDAPPMAILLAAGSLEKLQRYTEAAELLERFLIVEPNAKDVAERLRSLQQRARAAAEGH